MKFIIHHLNHKSPNKVLLIESDDYSSKYQMLRPKQKCMLGGLRMIGTSTDTFYMSHTSPILCQSNVTILGDLRQ